MKVPALHVYVQRTCHQYMWTGREHAITACVHAHKLCVPISHVRQCTVGGRREYGGIILLLHAGR